MIFLQILLIRGLFDILSDDSTGDGTAEFLGDINIRQDKNFQVPIQLRINMIPKIIYFLMILRQCAASIHNNMGGFVIFSKPLKRSHSHVAVQCVCTARVDIFTATMQLGC